MTFHRLLPILLLVAFGSPFARSQMQPHARLDAELLPIVAYDDEFLTVLKDGEKRRTWDMSTTIRAGASFADGFVAVSEVVANLDPLKDAKPAERVKPDAIRFHYQAKITADRSLTNCYGLLTFMTEGSIGTKLVRIGKLSAGKPKAIEVKLPTRVDAVTSLHIFSNAQEVRSTDHPDAYDVMAYYAELTRKITVLSATELLKAEDVYSHELSRDGRYLAALRKRDAKKLLIVYDLESMKVLSEAAVTEADDLVTGITWVSDHEVVFVAEEDRDGDERSEYNLHLMDALTGQTRQLTDHVYDVLSALPEDPSTLVLYYGWCTEWFNVRTGKSSNRVRIDAQTSGGGYLMFDRKGNDRVQIGYDGDKVTYWYRPAAGASWKEIDEAVKQPGLHFNVRGPQLLDRVVDVHSVAPDGDTLYVSTRLNGADRFELAAYNLSTGLITRTIAKHPRYDLTTGDGGIARLLFLKDSPQLIGLIYEADKPQVVWLDPVYAAIQKAMDHTFPDHVNLPVDWSKDASTFIYFSTNERDPGTYYVFKPRESRLIPLLELGERLKGKNLAPTEAIQITCRDGQKIPAYLTRPTGETTGPAPLLVSIHGGPMARDGIGFNPLNQFFASRGYAVLQVNYRGSSGYGAAFQAAGLKARLDTVVIDDIADGVRYLIDQKIADPGRIAVTGGSFGGWATYMSLIKYPELYRAGIAIAAVSHWRKSIHNSRWQFNNKLGYTFWKSVLSRENFAADEKFIDPFLRAAEIKQPIFIIHGEWDNVVSSVEAGLMLEALKKQNPNVQARSFTRASHTYWSFEDRVVMLNEMAAFLERYVHKAAPAASPAHGNAPDRGKTSN